MYGNMLMGMPNLIPQSKQGLMAPQGRMTIGPGPAAQRALEGQQTTAQQAYQSPSQGLFEAYMQNIWKRQVPPGGGMQGGLFSSPTLPAVQRPQAPSSATPQTWAPWMGTPQPGGPYYTPQSPV